MYCISTYCGFPPEGGGLFGVECLRWTRIDRLLSRSPCGRVRIELAYIYSNFEFRVSNFEFYFPRSRFVYCISTYCGFPPEGGLFGVERLRWTRIDWVPSSSPLWESSHRLCYFRISSFEFRILFSGNGDLLGFFLFFGGFASRGGEEAFEEPEEDGGEEQGQVEGEAGFMHGDLLAEVFLILIGIDFMRGVGEEGDAFFTNISGGAFLGGCADGDDPFLVFGFDGVDAGAGEVREISRRNFGAEASADEGGELDLGGFCGDGVGALSGAYMYRAGLGVYAFDGHVLGEHHGGSAGICSEGAPVFVYSKTACIYSACAVGFIGEGGGAEAFSEDGLVGAVVQL